ncbi:hypothetical protein NBT05_09615 [Aquimarina sp. ERC-38]|uniref:hypothetical protein n=1 Tax=Aquimarina sp. ERC-38 TaxID=2949996 RepID=UPI002247B9D7|nr:hypothetical protein [Aquimarina sp. ERC-38]UZO79228.1 hypothetical protein NBT05_09615 [Aquimarina sp. ERC-38]
MLFTYPSVQITHRKKIEELIGKPFTLKERNALGGTTSRLLRITEVSIQIYNLLVVDQEPMYCQIALRTKGILVHLGSKADKYALPIPYYKLVVYKGRSEEYSIHKDTYFVKFEVLKDQVEVHQFLKKITDQKSNQAFTYIDDL